MADFAGGSGVAQIIAASGTALAAVIGAAVLWPTRRRRERAAASVDHDPEDGAGRLRERLTAVEVLQREHGRRLDHVDEEMALLRAQEITAEGHMPRPPRRRRTEK